MLVTSGSGVIKAEKQTQEMLVKRESDFCLSFHVWKVALSLPTLKYPGSPFTSSPKSLAHTCPQIEDDCFNFCGVWFPRFVSDNILWLL